MKKLVYDGKTGGFSMMMLIEVWAHTAGECFASETDVRLPKIAWDRFVITMPPNQLAAWKGMILSAVGGTPGMAEIDRLEAEAKWVVDMQLPRTEVLVQIEGMEYRFVNLSSRPSPFEEPWKPGTARKDSLNVPAAQLANMAQMAYQQPSFDGPTKEELRRQLESENWHETRRRHRAQEEMERYRYERARAAMMAEPSPNPSGQLKFEPEGSKLSRFIRDFTMPSIW